MPQLTFRPEPFGGFEEFDEWEGEVSRSNSEYVKWVQQSLNKILGLNLAVDGVSGPLTRSAVRTFQQRARLLVDGIVGPKTEAALVQAGAAAPPGSGSVLGFGAPPAGTSPCAAVRKPCEVLDKFDFDRDQVKAQHQPRIINVARCILASRKTSDPIRTVRVVGHTDSEGDDAYNVGLGRRRAEQVKRHLRDTLERILPGSSAGVTIDTDTRGEAQPAAADAPTNRRVEVCLPQPPVIIPPKPKPVTKSFKIVAKSFIMIIGSRVGATRCVIGRDDDTLAGLATATDASFHENPATDVKDRIYRLFSSRTFTVTCLEGRVVSFGATPLDMDMGQECDPTRTLCIDPPPLAVVSNAAGPSGVSSIDFTWRVKGRPPRKAEIAFFAVCPRDSVFIWHEISGRIECTASGPNLTSISIIGSQSPSHRVWVDGVVRGFKPQGNFSNLWIGTPGDPTLVR